jgi:hypothetical protein
VWYENGEIKILDRAKDIIISGMHLEQRLVTAC